MNPTADEQMWKSLSIERTSPPGKKVVVGAFGDELCGRFGVTFGALQPRGPNAFSEDPAYFLNQTLHIDGAPHLTFNRVFQKPAPVLRLKRLNTISGNSSSFFVAHCVEPLSVSGGDDVAEMLIDLN
jgi:hypothetical protein